MSSFAEITASTKNAIIIASKIDTYDKACSLIGLYKSLLLNKINVDTLVLGKVPVNIMDLFEKNNALFITEIKPRSFEISIDYGSSSIEKIVYDDLVDEKRLKFLITPGSSDFSFDSVQMKEGGAKYDTTILFDIEDPKKIGNLYDQHDYLFRENNVVSIGVKTVQNAGYTISISEASSYSESVYNTLKESKMKIGKEGVEVLLNGTINYRKLLESSEPLKGKSLKVLSSLVSDGADLSKTLKEVYFSKSAKNADIHLALMQNIKVNQDQSLVWSLVEKSEVDKIGISVKELDLRGRLPFNISDKYMIALGAIEVKESEYIVIIESNDTNIFNALDFANLFGGKGDASHAKCTIKFWKSSEFESKLIEILPDLVK